MDHAKHRLNGRKPISPEKRFLVGLIGLMELMIMGTALTASSAENGMLTNPGFEVSPLVAAPCPASGWNCTPNLSGEAYAGSGALVRLDEQTVHSGKRSLLLASDRARKSPHLYITQWLPTTVLPEGDWTLSAWVKTEPYQGETLPVALLLNVHAAETGRSLGHAETFAVGREWRKIAVAVPVPPCGGNPWVALGFQPHGEPGTGRIWVDDFHIERSGEGYQAIADANMARDGKGIPSGTKATFHWMPLRDGTRLRTLQFVPPGDGPFPVILQRSVYTYGAPAVGYVGQGRAVVGQILYNAGCLKPHGQYDPYFYTEKVSDTCNAEGWNRQQPWEKHVGPFGIQGHGPAKIAGASCPRKDFDPYSYKNEIADTYDACEWIAKQPWCNGRIGTLGGSGSGIGATMAPLAGSPHLVVTSPSASGGEALLYWGFINGVRRNTIFGWMQRRGVDTATWPRPTIRRFDEKQYRAFTRSQAEKGSFKGAYMISSGWYDLYTESLLDAFNDFKDTARCIMQIGFNAHGGTNGTSWETILFPKRDPGVDFNRLFVRALESDSKEGFPEKSTIYYYLLGDVKDATAPGNIYRTTTSWPPAECRLTPYYFHQGGLLATGKPAIAGSLSYTYDPNNPVPTLGGATFGLNAGPADQRPLQNRTDILRFQTPRLERAVTLTGPITVELYVSTDVQDTLFTAKLVDVYPDGYQMILQDAPFMTRFREGRHKEVPMEPGRITKIRFPVWSVANAFNRGHRIAVHISSSNAQRFEVHPNTWEPVDSMKKASVAHQTLHLSPDTPSHVMLPVMAGNEQVLRE